MDPSSNVDFYHVLGVGRYAQSSDIREAYRRLALERHPDKDHENPHADANFQEADVAVSKLQEAYETLYDENKRRVYDAECFFPQQGFRNTQMSSGSYQPIYEEVAEGSRVADRDREWLAQAQSRISEIERLRQESMALKASLEALQLRERERRAQEDSAIGPLRRLSSLWSAKAAKATEEKRKEEMERKRQRWIIWSRLREVNMIRQQIDQSHVARLWELARIKDWESMRDQRAREQEEARARGAAFKQAQYGARRRPQTEER